MSELAKRLREWADMLRKDGYADCPADLLAAADIVERAEWRPIPAKLEIPEDGILVGKWVEGEWWTEKVDLFDWAINAEFTHYFHIPAPPEVKP